MSNKVLIIVGDATETLDTMYPFYRLQEGGYEPVAEVLFIQDSEKTSGKILALIRNNPHLTIPELAAALSMTYRSVERRSQLPWGTGRSYKTL